LRPPTASPAKLFSARLAPASNVAESSTSCEWRASLRTFSRCSTLCEGAALKPRQPLIDYWMGSENDIST
jgi:hypothetical protein